MLKGWLKALGMCVNVSHAVKNKSRAIERCLKLLGVCLKVVKCAQRVLMCQKYLQGRLKVPRRCLKGA